MQPVYFIFGLLTLWLAVITGLFIYIFRFFRQLSAGVDKGNLLEILKKILEKETNNSQAISETLNLIGRLERDSKLHIQKVNYLRFNPFEELGGDHSFSVSLLDGHDSGIIMTGLHSRERTRVYVKQIIKGKSKIELSKEEKNVLKLAQKGN